MSLAAQWNRIQDLLVETLQAEPLENQSCEYIEASGMFIEPLTETDFVGE